MEIINYSSVYLNDILDIEKKSFARPWTKTAFLNSSKNPAVQFKIALDGQKLIGYCVFQIAGNEGEILNIAVKPEERGKSYGRKLLESIFDVSVKKHCENLFLEVAESNVKALSLYEMTGFKKINVRKKYYANEDAVIMKKALK
ncbi:MAG: ribosomal protein S18-alanine N-acetyltransferase [Endomicrobium sp.]|nr:ribosomal protein S18-alanine N-acetyltransferase [Endomicrobium sp.]